MDPEERKRLRERAMSGILGFGRNVYQGNPLLRAVGDPIRDVYRSYDVGLQSGVPQVVMSDAHPSRLTLTTNKHPAPMDARSIDALKKSRLAQIQQNEINKYRNALANNNTIAMGQVAPAAMSGAAQPMPEKKEDEYGFLDAMFLANLVAGMQGGPPPTPYGTAVGGGNKTWASLPSLMRMS
jgi:hypothetical protein